MKKWGISETESVFLCDDDNDLELAAHVARAFLPSITSVRKGGEEGQTGHDMNQSLAHAGISKGSLGGQA